jgi:TPR repeat protein
MNKVRVLTGIVLLLFFTSQPLWAGYEKGLAALKRNDYKTAVKEWMPLAKKGNTDIQATLAVLYHTGQGVRQNYQQAFRWYRQAAIGGNVAAQANLGVMYAKGTGTPRDYVKSYAWYSVAADALSLDKLGSALWGIDYLATQMTEAQIKQAKRLTDELTRKYSAKLKLKK